MTDTDLAAQLRAKAEEMLRQAENLEKLAAGDTPTDEVVDGEAVEVEAVEPLPDEPVVGLPEDPESIRAERDPLEPMNMREELEKIRLMLPQRGFLKRGESAAGEVWEKPGPNGQPGFRLTLTADPHGRINAEIRDPAGLVIGNASPAQLIDVEIALQRVR